MSNTQLNINLLPKQFDFVKAQHQEVLYSGAFGAGKTRALCVKLLTHARIPGNFAGLCRKYFSTIRQTTLRTLLEPESGLPAVLPQGTYTHNKAEHIIDINNGGKIVYFGLDKAEKIGSYNLGFVGVDEAVELTEADWIMLLGRLRNTVDPHRQIAGATNPGSEQHFLYQRFFIERDPERLAIQTTSAENLFLPDDYKQLLEKFTGQTRARYVEGKWGSFEGLVYDIFDSATHRIHRPATDFVRWHLGIDEGYTNPAVVLLIGEDNDGRLHVFREFYKRRVMADEQVATAAAWWKEVKCTGAYPDPSAAGLIAQLKAAGIGCREVDNEILSGIRAVQNALQVAGDGRPRLTISPECEYTLKEIGSYQWAKGKDQPRKEFDHAMDSLRYVVYALTTAPKPGPIFMQTRKVIPMPNSRRGRLVL